MPPERTEDVFILHQVFPAPPGWQLAYWDVERGEHTYAPLYFMALATRRAYVCEDDRSAPRRSHAERRVDMERYFGPEEENREVVPLAFYDLSGFDVAEVHTNFCGLVPPGVVFECSH